MSKLIDNIASLKEDKTHNRKMAADFRNEARRMSDLARSVSDEISQLQTQAVRELLAQDPPANRHSSFTIKQSRYHYGQYSVEPEEAWAAASREFHEAWTRLVYKKIELLEYYQNNPDQVNPRGGITVEIVPENAVKPPREPWASWRSHPDNSDRWQ